MSFENTSTTLADTIGSMMEAVFGFFSNVSMGYITILVVFSIIFFIIYFFKFSGKEVRKLA